jgi:2-oxo-3-hexenedioate decarboxylase
MESDREARDACAVLAEEIRRATVSMQTIASLPTSRPRGLTLDEAYAVERELRRLREAEGHRTVGLKVGFANRAVWRALKLDTLVWAHMYDDTVHIAQAGRATLSTARFTSPKIEPEIVFKLKTPLAAGLDAAAALASVEWLALGFEIIDCVFADWKFQPPDFVAAHGLHAGLIVGTPLPVTDAEIPALVDALPRFTVQLSCDGQVVAEGSGKNSLRSPALCLAELGSALAARGDLERLSAGALISSGTLTESQPIRPGQIWAANVAGLAVEPLTLHI